MKTQVEGIEINFNKEDSDERTESGWNWFYGTAKQGNKEFAFSLCEMNTKVGGQNTTAIDITWVNDTPDNYAFLEQEIEVKFEEKFVC